MNENVLIIANKFATETEISLSKVIAFIERETERKNQFDVKTEERLEKYAEAQQRKAVAELQKTLILDNEYKEFDVPKSIVSSYNDSLLSRL